MEKKAEKIGTYRIETEDPELLDDYRYADNKILEVPFYGPEVEPIRLAQDLWLGKGGIFWDGEYIITRYIQKYILPKQHGLNCKIYTERKLLVIEIGAGTALPTIICAMEGHKCIATDLKKILPLTQKCVELNQARIKTGLLEVKELLWGNKEQIEGIKKDIGRVDCIICSEVVYEKEYVKDLVDTLDELSTEKTEIILIYKERDPEILQEFLGHFGKVFDWKEVDREVVREIHPNKKEHLLVAHKKLS